MRLERGWRVGVALEIGAVGEAVAKEDVHDGARERAVRSGPKAQGEIGLPHRLCFVDVDGDDLGAVLLPGSDGVGHHVDLGGDGVGSPDHHAVRLRHLARVGADQLPRSGDVARPGDSDADRAVKAGIALGVGQALDPVAHHEAHRAGVVIRPNALGPKSLFRCKKACRDPVERLVPTDRRELAGAFWPDPHQRLCQAVGVVDALGVARDLGADNPRRVALLGRAANAPDPRAADDLDVKGADRRAVMRADRGFPDDFAGDVHARLRSRPPADLAP